MKIQQDLRKISTNDIGASWRASLVESYYIEIGKIYGVFWKLSLAFRDADP